MFSNIFRATILSLLTVLIAECNHRQLKLVHLVFRHGQRTPADTYPNDPYINATLDPVGWGQLTNPGKLFMFHNGQYIRHRYNKFLGDEYKPSVVHVQSTDADRAIASAQLMSAGIWPPNHVQKWGPLNWQPVPTHADPLNKDKLLLVRIPCAQYHLELEKVMSEGNVKQQLKDNQELFFNLTRITGLEIHNFDDVQSLYSTLWAEEGFNLTLPSWTKDYYPDKLEPLTEYSYIVNAYNNKLKRLKGGVLLRKLLVDWYQKSNQHTNSTSELVHELKSDEWIKEASVYGEVTAASKLFLFSGHDSTVTNLLRALNVWDPQMPGYGITVILELHQDLYTEEFGVQIYLRNQTNHEPRLLTIPGCDSFCPLDQLTTLVDPVIPRDLIAECKSDDPDFVHPELGGP